MQIMKQLQPTDDDDDVSSVVSNMAWTPEVDVDVGRATGKKERRH